MDTVGFATETSTSSTPGTASGTPSGSLTDSLMQSELSDGLAPSNPSGGRLPSPYTKATEAFTEVQDSIGAQVLGGTPGTSVMGGVADLLTRSSASAETDDASDTDVASADTAVVTDNGASDTDSASPDSAVVTDSGASDTDSLSEAAAVTDSANETLYGAAALARAFDSSQPAQKRIEAGIYGGGKTTAGVSNLVNNTALSSDAGGQARAQLAADVGAVGAYGVEGLQNFRDATESAEKGDVITTGDKVATANDRLQRTVDAAWDPLNISEDLQRSNATVATNSEGFMNVTGAVASLANMVGAAQKSNQLGEAGELLKLERRVNDNFKYDKQARLDAVKAGRKDQLAFDDQNAAGIQAEALEEGLGQLRRNANQDVTMELIKAAGNTTEAAGLYGAVPEAKLAGSALKAVAAGGELGRSIDNRAQNVSAAVDMRLAARNVPEGPIGKTFGTGAEADTFLRSLQKNELKPNENDNRLVKAGKATASGAVGLTAKAFKGPLQTLSYSYKGATSAYNQVYENATTEEGAVKNPVRTGAKAIAAGAAAGTAGLVGGTVAGAATTLGSIAGTAADLADGTGSLISGGVKYATPTAKAAKEAFTLGDTDKTFATNWVEGTQSNLNKREAQNVDSRVNAVTGGLAQGVASAVSGGVNLGMAAGKTTFNGVYNGLGGSSDASRTRKAFAGTAGAVAGVGAAALGGTLGATAGLVGGTAQGLTSAVRGAGRAVRATPETLGIEEGKSINPFETARRGASAGFGDTWERTGTPLMQTQAEFVEKGVPLPPGLGVGIAASGLASGAAGLAGGTAGLVVGTGIKAARGAATAGSVLASKAKYGAGAIASGAGALKQKAGSGLGAAAESTSATLGISPGKPINPFETARKGAMAAGGGTWSGTGAKLMNAQENLTAASVPSPPALGLGLAGAGLVSTAAGVAGGAAGFVAGLGAKGARGVGQLGAAINRNVLETTDVRPFAKAAEFFKPQDSNALREAARKEFNTADKLGNLNGLRQNNPEKFLDLQQRGEGTKAQRAQDAVATAARRNDDLGRIGRQAQGALGLEKTRPEAVGLDAWGDSIDSAAFMNGGDSPPLDPSNPSAGDASEVGRESSVSPPIDPT